MASESVSGNSPTTQQPASNSINRRSLSIFSRRGADTPTPATQALALTSMTMAFTPPPTVATPATPQKAKRWKLTKSMEAKIPEGTILRMVPKEAPKVNMTPLEVEMATSPNEEILRNIGMNATESAPTSPVLQSPSSPLADITNTSPRRYYSKRERKNSQSDIIGVWRNGKAQWEQNKLAVGGTDSNGRPKTADGIPSFETNIQSSKSQRPRIQVIIPGNLSSRRPFSFVPFFTNSAVDLHSKGITVSHTVSQDVSPPSVCSNGSVESFQISAIATPTVLHKPKPRRPYAPISTTIDEAPNCENGLFPEQLTLNSKRSASSNSSSSESESEESQPRSSRSSMTSLGEHSDGPSASKRKETHSRRGSADSTLSLKQDISARAEFEAPLGSPVQPAELEGSPVTEAPRMGDLVSMMRTPSMRRPRNSRRYSSRRNTNQLARIDSKEELRTDSPPSPTLSEAERNLEDQLRSSQGRREMEEVTLQSPIPSIVLSPVEVPAPPPPRRSSKRKARAPSAAASAAFASAAEATQLARQQRQQQMERFQQQSYTKPAIRRSDSVRSVLSLVFEDDEFTKVDARSAEMVIFHMLSNLQTMQDLFNTAVINKGFYRVFKRHELELMRQTLHNMCPAAWEYRETCGPNEDEDDLYSAAPAPDYTPSAYIQAHNADIQVISAVKGLILERCQSMLRPETVAALKNETAFTASRVDNALWRIWIFCRVFGCDKGREDDVIAQMDWLRGGVLAHQETCTSTISTSDSFYISSVLLSAPAHFAQGNEGGLSAEELYDMLELWNCFTSITSGLVGHTDEARKFGLYDNTEVRGGDIDGEEAMLEEWHFYILTLGLSPILDLVTRTAAGDPTSVFKLAQNNGWMFWNPPPMGGSRSTFLREPLSRLYEEKICQTFSPSSCQLQEMRSIRRARAASFATELRQRKLNSLSVRSTQSERPMSGWEGVMDRLNNSPLSMQGPFTATGSSSSPAPTVVRRQSSVQTVVPFPTRIAPPPPPPRRRAPPTPVQQHAFPTYEEERSYPEDTTELPPYDGRPPSWQQHPAQRAISDGDRSLNSAEKAVFRIVEMGFTPEEAKGALKITDMGDGLRLDRAIEFLLRQKEQAF